MDAGEQDAARTGDPFGAGDTSTLPEHRSADDVARDRNLRRVGLIAAWGLLALAAAGAIGVPTAAVSARASGWSLQVEHPRIIRPAVDSPIKVRIAHDGGFDEPVRLRMPRSLFEHLDVNLVSPAPDGETGTDRYVEWTYEPPDQDVIVIGVDSRLSPAEMPGPQELGFAVVDESGAVLVDLSSSMFVMP